MSQQRLVGASFRRRSAFKLLLSDKIFSCRAGCLGNNTQLFGLQTLIFGGFGMKVVLFKSPKFMSGILRLIFGIKKQNT